MDRRTIILGLAIVLAASAAAGCVGNGETDGEAVELRSYRVPEGYDPDDVRNDIRRSLDTGEVKLGTVQTYPDGSLVVTASPGIQEGVARMLDDLASRGPAAARPAAETVTLRYWALLARPAGGSVPTAPPILREGGLLEPVAGELVATYGPMDFALLEELRLTSSDDGARSGVVGDRFQVQQRVMRAPDGTSIVDIEAREERFRGQPHAIETRVRLDPGNLVVLAQSAYRDDGYLPPGWGQGDDPLLLLVVAEPAD